MASVSGLITQVTAETKMSKTGKPFKVYSIEVNGSWYEAGFKAPARVGENVTFEYTLSYGKQKITDGTFMVAGAGGARPFVAAASAGTASARTPSASSKTFPIPVDHPDRSIIRQNAVTRATELVVASGALAGGDFANEVYADSVAASVIALAKRFEGYYSGELDSVQARMAESETVV